MMMTGEGAAHAPPWQQQSAEGDDAYALLAALRRYLPSNDSAAPYGEEDDDDAVTAALDAYACDEFRMYEFKVRRCARGRSHDWTDCPFAHPGEEARRRDPRRFHYSGTACPDFRKGGCRRRDSCEFAHGVFECWLHPARYRTQPCKDGVACRRRVCFFAHTPNQLRVLPPQLQSASPRGASTQPLAESYDGSPLRRQAFESYLANSMMSSSPTSTLVSPPRSPSVSLRLGRAYGSTKSTPTAPSPVTITTPSGATFMTIDRLNLGLLEEVEEPVMERVESGRALREKVFERLSKDAATVPNDTSANATAEGAPDVGWVTDLIS
jgi:hypothetical protein